MEKTKPGISIGNSEGEWIGMNLWKQVIGAKKGDYLSEVNINK